MDQTSERDERQGAWDPVVSRLHELRASRGMPSFGSIAQSITERRQAEGVSEHAARVARSTVYDAFRTGRPRLNLPFVREIVGALGADPALADVWRAECLLRAERAAAAPELPVEVDAAEPGAVDALVLMLVCLGLNLLGRVVVDALDLALYLDMVGTAVAAISLGPWRGALVGVATNVMGMAISGADSLPFLVVNAAGALVWGYGVRRWGLARSFPRFFLLDLLVAWVCSALAVPILLAMFGDSLPIGGGSVVRIVVEPIHTYWLALTASNLLTSTADKLLSGFIALVAVSALPASFRTALPLAQPSAQLRAQPQRP